MAGGGIRSTISQILVSNFFVLHPILAYEDLVGVEVLT